MPASSDNRRPWRTLLELAWPHRRSFALVALFAALSSAASLAEPLVYRSAVNDVSGVFVARALDRSGATDTGPRRAAPHRSPAPHHRPHRPSVRPSPAHPHPHQHTKKAPHRRGHVAPRTAQQMLTGLMWAVGLLFLTGLATHLFELLADNSAAAAANRIEEDFIRRTFAHVLRLRLDFFGRRSSGALAKQIDQSDQVAPIVTSFAKDILPEVFQVVGTFAIMSSQSVKLTAIALATVPVYLLVARRSARDLETDLPKYFTLWEEVSARIRDAVAAVKTVKLSGAEDREVARLQSASHAAYATYLERNRLANRYAFWQSLLQQIGKALVFAYGGWAVVKHQLTPGDVVMFVAYLDRLYAPIDSLTSLAKTLQEHALSLGRAVSLLALRATEPSGEGLRPGPGRVEFRDVRFAYVPGQEVLCGVSFALEPGSVTALVGPSGAGKTTIADLLLRLHDVDSGEISIDGQPIASLDPASLRRAISVVSTDGAIFRGTLADNIRYKRSDASDAEVEVAARAAGLARTFERLPAGLATEIGEGGVGLSVGERQRVQIARALVSTPRILVLDEATANLDFATEEEIKEGLARWRHGRTTLIVAHRYSMVREVDRALVLEAGRIVEAGTPHELLAAGGWFARLAAGAADAPPSDRSDDGAR